MHECASATLDTTCDAHNNVGVLKLVQYSRLTLVFDESELPANQSPYLRWVDVFRMAWYLASDSTNSIVDDTISANWGERSLIYFLVENGTDCR